MWSGESGCQLVVRLLNLVACEDTRRAGRCLAALLYLWVRELAREAGLAVAGKGESMEICFVDRGVREFIEDERPELPRAGAEVTTSAGEVLGEGAPTYRYTVGQRRGRFSEAQPGVAPGQAAVFYSGTQVLGGCWIESALP